MSEDAGSRRGKSARSGGLRSVSTPKQERSEATLQRLLAAADKLICRDGLASVSIAAIVREAKSSVGGFYARFKDKDELLRALHERQLRTIRDLLQRVVNPERWKGVDLRRMIEALLDAHTAQSQGRERLVAAFLEASARNPEAWEPAIAFRREVVESTVALLLLRREEITHDDPELAVRFAVQQAFAVHDMRSLYGDTSAVHGTISDEFLTRETARSMHAYLTAAPT